MAAGVFLTLVGCVNPCSARVVQLGPLRPAPSVALYVVGDGQPCQARLLIREGEKPQAHRILVRVFDPDETLVFWRYVEYVNPDSVGDVPRHPDIELRPLESAQGVRSVLLNVPLDLKRTGVHQIRVSRGGGQSTVGLELERPLEYGASFGNGLYSGWTSELTPLFVYVPPHAEQLTISGQSLNITGIDGAKLAELPGGGSRATLPVSKTDVVWRFEPSAADWSLRATGFPLILCSSEPAAKTIRASVEVLPDGTVVCHKFQRRIAEMLPKLLAPENVGNTKDLIVPLAERKDAWLAAPQQNAKLKNAFLPTIEKWLRGQNLDPNSHWGGSLAGWKKFIDQPAPANRWDRLRSVKGLWGGASSHYHAGAEHLALAAVHNAPTNPYFGKRELLYRAAAAALRDLMALGEDEVWRGVGADVNPYPGMMAFAVGQKTFPVFGIAAPELPVEVRTLWGEALRHIVDRSYPDGLVSARNQSSHYLVAYEAFADGTDKPLDHAMSRLYARRFVRGQHPAGWHMEATGPDSSYTGMTHWHMGVYYFMSKDPIMLESLRRSYRFFNHTVAPEPDGKKILGGFNFNHRVGEGFYFEQWGGAKGVVDDSCPEIGLWADLERRYRNTPEAQAKAAASVTKFLADPKIPRYAGIATARYLGWAPPDRSGVLPALEKEPFIRNLCDQLIAVKRPGYYTTCFVGKPAAADFYIRQRHDFRLPLPENAENSGGTFNVRKITPFLGGGLTGIWTPEYGHALLATNWAPSTHHGIIATNADGKRYWEDYFAHSFTLDTEKGTLTIKGRIESVPLDYVRTYEFHDNAIAVHLELTATQDLALNNLIENIPVARGAWKSRGAEIAADAKTDGAVITNRVTITDKQGAGIAIVLDKPRELHIQPEGLQTGGWRKLQIGRVAITLRPTLKKGETETLSYQLVPL